MIPVGAIPSYAQHNEDIILLALLWDVKKGFYVDVGANYEVIDSVTKLFYDQGWRGINIEPIASLYEQLKKHRSRDINLHLGMGDEKSELEFYENVTKPGHSSFSAREAMHDLQDNIRQYRVKIDTLRNVLSRYGQKHIHFLKIDVEGFEKQVIDGNDWDKYRPEVVCIESNHQPDAWKRQLTKHRYKLFITDGLNSYYVANEAWHRTEGYAERVVNLSYQSLKQHHYEAWREDSRQLEKVTKLNQIHYDMAQSYKSKDAKGLTTDWLRDKMRKKKKL